MAIAPRRPTARRLARASNSEQNAPLPLRPIVARCAPASSPRSFPHEPLLGAGTSALLFSYAPPPVSPVSIELFVDVTYGSKPAISAAACAFFRCASDVLPPVTGAAASVLLDPLQRDASTLGLSPAGGAKARPCVVAS